MDSLFFASYVGAASIKKREDNIEYNQYKVGWNIFLQGRQDRQGLAILVLALVLLLVVFFLFHHFSRFYYLINIITQQVAVCETPLAFTA